MDGNKNRIDWKLGHGVIHRIDGIQQMRRGSAFLKGAVMSCETDVLSGATQILCSGDVLVAV